MGKEKQVQSDHYGYLHGYDKKEQLRLLKQAQFLEPSVYKNIVWPRGSAKILEPGCGVGAQSAIMLRRFPEIHITGLDRSKSQLSAAKQNLSKHIKDKRVTLVHGSGEKLPFDEASFHGAFICWLLEHVPDPTKLLKEIHRVLQPGSIIYATEVLNSSFYLSPYSPATLQYWFHFNDHQWNMGGDPFCGAKLGNLLLDAGYQEISTEVISHHLDKRFPKTRNEHLKSFYNLLLSAAPNLLKEKKVDEKLVEEMKKEWKAAQDNPEAILFFSYVQARAVAL